jgi:hypothetical protein
MKDDPNDRVMACKVLAGDVLEMIKTRHGYDAYLF